MAGVEKTLRLKDGFSSVLDKYIDKLSDSIAKEEALAKMTDVVNDATRDWAREASEYADDIAIAMKKAADAGNPWDMLAEGFFNDALDKASVKLIKTKDDIEVVGAAVKDIAESGMNVRLLEVAFARFNKVLAENGGYWTELSDNYNRFDLLANNSVDTLIKKGLIVKDGMGDLQTKLDEIVTEAAQADAVYQEAIDKRIKAAEEEGAELQKILDYLTAGPKKIAKLTASLLGLDKAAKKFNDIKTGVEKLDNPFKKLSKTVLRMGLSFFTVAKLVQYFKAGVSRAPDEIANKFTKLKNTLGDFFAGPTVAAMDRMGAGIERLNQAFNSPSGQKFARGMEAIGRIIGDIVSVAFERLAQFVEWCGEHMEPIAIAAGIAFAIWAAHMMTLAVATAAANAPLLLMVGLVAAVTAGLYKAGATADEVFGYIGGALGALYAFGYNLIADGYNTIASFAEFFANVFNDPIGEVGRLFLNLADVALGALERIARAVDKIFNKNLASTVTSWRSQLNTLAGKLESGDRYTIDRMEALDYNDVIAKAYSKGSGFGAGLSDYALKNAEAQDIKSIAQNTSAIKDTLQDEDLTALIDMAERQFVSNVNLTAQTPVITVNGANTGNTEADRNALARAIAQILADQIATMPTVPSPAFNGGRG